MNWTHIVKSPTDQYWESDAPRAQIIATSYLTGDAIYGTEINTPATPCEYEAHIDCGDQWLTVGKFTDLADAQRAATVKTSEHEKMLEHEIPSVDELKQSLPELLSVASMTLDHYVRLKFTLPESNLTWYAARFGGEDTFFGLVIEGAKAELHFFSLAELLKLRSSASGLPVKCIVPWRSAALRDIYKRHGLAIPNESDFASQVVEVTEEIKAEMNRRNEEINRRNEELHKKDLAIIADFNARQEALRKEDEAMADDEDDDFDWDEYYRPQLRYWDDDLIEGDPDAFQDWLDSDLPNDYDFEEP